MSLQHHIIRMFLSLVIIGLLAAIGSNAPICIDSPLSSSSQEGFSQPEIHGDGIRVFHRDPSAGGNGSDGDNVPVIRLSPGSVLSGIDVYDMMQKIIASQMRIRENGRYMDSLISKPFDMFDPNRFYACGTEVLSRLTIEIIPVKSVSSDIACTSESCSVALEKTVTVSTACSVESSMALEVSGKVFGAGVAFTAPLGFGFSATNKESTNLIYTFNLAKGDVGYIVWSTSKSAKIRYHGCRCKVNVYGSSVCERRCKDSTNPDVFDDTKYHQSVILQHGKPKGFIAFAPWSGNVKE